MFASLEEYQKVREAVALEHGFALYKQYGEAQAAAFIGVDLTTLKRWRRDGHVPFVNLGQRQLRYFGYQVADILILGRDKCLDIQSAIFSSATIGSHKTESPQSGNGVGLTKPQGRPDVQALAQQTFKKPSKP